MKSRRYNETDSESDSKAESTSEPTKDHKYSLYISKFRHLTCVASIALYRTERVFGGRLGDNSRDLQIREKSFLGGIGIPLTFY
jgi:hypothetical protein